MFICRFVLLILESARVEIAVLLNELAFLKYDETPKSSTSREESIQQKQRSLAIAFSLLEGFIKMISSGAEGNPCGGFLLQTLSNVLFNFGTGKKPEPLTAT